MFILFQL